MGDYKFEQSPLYEYFQYGGRWNYKDDHDFVKNKTSYFEMKVEVIGESGSITCIINKWDMRELAYLTRTLGKIKTVNIIELLN